MEGKEIRLRRLIRKGKMICVPMDHGITTGNIGNLMFFEKTVGSIINNGATCIVLHKGMLKFLEEIPQTVGLILHLSASTNMNLEVKKILVCDVAEAIALGADAVSVHINFGNKYEKEMINDFAQVSKECKQYGIPLLAMVYVRNDNNEDISTPHSLWHSIRIATELGADIIKISFKPSWNIGLLSEFTNFTTAPIVVAGGELYECREDFYSYTSEMIKAGVLGISFGRNVFMSEDPAETMKALCNIVYKTEYNI